MTLGSAIDNAVEADALLARRAGRDPDAFAALYERYVEAVYRYTYRRLGTREQAEDATSQVFHKAYASLASYQGGSFRAWLFSIAHNVVVDSYRRGHQVWPLDEAHEVPDRARSPEDLAIAADEQRTLHECVRLLAPDQRRVVELRLAGLTGAEIAQVLDCNVGAIKMLQHRAMTRLRELMGAQSITSTTREVNDDR